MPKDYRLALGEAALVAEPGCDFFACYGVGYGLRAFTNEVQLAFAGAVTHPGEVIGDDPKSRHAAQAVVPHIGVVPVHLGEKLLAAGALQGVLDLPGAIQRVLHRPYGRDASVHHGDAILRISQRLVVQPFNQLLAVRRVENVVEVVFPAGATRAAGDGH